LITRVKDSWRVVVSVEALGCSVSVELDAEHISPDSPSISKGIVHAHH
jgi:hypothetical protein